MPVKIRLTRQGRKKRPYYHIVVADSRAPRDGRFIETLGNYDPNTNPATIELNFDKTLEWVLKGAQPTDTCRAILSYKGVMYKKHLKEGVKKNAFSDEEADKRFTEWLKGKEEKIQAKRELVNQSKGDLNKKRFEAEAKVKEARLKEIAAKKAKLAAKEAAAEAPEEVTEQVETATEQIVPAEEIAPVEKVTPPVENVTPPAETTEESEV